MLSEKHLYQSVKVDESFVTEVAETLLRNAEDRMVPTIPFTQSAPRRTVLNFERKGIEMLESLWIPELGIANREGSQPVATATAGAHKSVKIPLPTINTRCPLCGGRWPFNPQEPAGKWERGRTTDLVQWFFLSYECQKCKGEPVRFLVKRQRTKLTLSGRDPIEGIEVPDVLPKANSGYFGSAVLAFQSGQTLAALFLLRVFIEQYWRNLQDVSDRVAEKTKPSGDELGEAYKETLPPDFKSRFPSLLETYGDLSAAMHLARPDDVVFNRARADIVEHFEARRLFRLQYRELASKTTSAAVVPAASTPRDQSGPTASSPA